jgi:hypothetical protein
VKTLQRFLLTLPGVGLVTGLVAFLVYLRTLAPGLTFIDSGELATVVCTLGIAHPTGYPLFTLLGRVAVLLPLGGEEIQKLNVLAALLTAAGAGVTAAACAKLVAGRDVRRAQQRKERLTPVEAGAAVGGGLLFAFTRTTWSIATSVEVYSLQALLGPLLLLLAFHAAEKGGARWWMAAAYVAGLGLANHMTTVLFLPGLLFLYFSTLGWGRQTLKSLVSLLPALLAGVSPYLYLPLRAAGAPMLNWGDPVTFERFLWHVTGKQYRVWMFSSVETAWRNGMAFLEGLPVQTAVVGVLAAVIGVGMVWRRSRRLAVCTFLVFAVTSAYAVNYDIQDIDTYFLFAHLCVALWAGAGLHAVGGALARRLPATVVAVGMAGVALLPLPVHYGVCDESGNHLVGDYTHNVFASVPPEAVVLSYQWDTWVSAAYYLQCVRGERQDITVIDKELLRRSWYLRQLERAHPWLIHGARGEVGRFLREVEKFEHELPYDGTVIEARYAEMIGGFLRTAAAGRPIFVTGEVEGEYTPGWRRVPEGLVFRLVRDSLFRPVPFPTLVYRPLSREGRLENLVRDLYADAYRVRAVYYKENGDSLEALHAIRAASGFSSPPGGQMGR